MKSHKLQNLMRIDDILQRFDTYINWFYGSGVAVADHRFRIKYELSEGLILGGNISRIDMTVDGYRGLLLGPIRPYWEQELRMPLIQRILAKEHGRSEDEFFVGYQELDASNIDLMLYPSSELDKAEEMARDLADKVSAEVKKYGSLP